jgi:hypothetical protein
LSAQAKFSGLARQAPWSNAAGGNLLGPDQFAPMAATDVIGQIARFAVENQMHAVLAPGHYLNKGSATDWFEVDRKACVCLRQSLDRAGGKHISIDYSLLVPHVLLNDIAQRGEFIDGLKDLPFDNLWVRASGFGAGVGPLTARRYINSLSSLHNLGKPIVADYLGGLVALAANSFGAISGFAEGIGERERFDARDWHKPPKPRDEDHTFGPVKRVAISGFGRTVTTDELKRLSEAKGGRRLVACGDRSCCPHGLSDMLSNPKRHSFNQRQGQVLAMERVPDLSRAQHFLDVEMAHADRLARQVKALRTGDDMLNKRMAEHSHRMEKMRATLEHFHETRGRDLPRALGVIHRMNAQESVGADRA